MAFLKRIGEFLRRLAMLVRGRQFDREMEEEMRLHRELRERDARAAGADATEARYAAQRQLGNELLLRERSREAWGWSWLDHFVQDVFFGLRLLGKSPGFTVIAVLTLALGIGANAAIFQLIDSLRIRTLPVEKPQELAEVRFTKAEWRSGNFDSRRPMFTNPQWELIRDKQQAFRGIVAWASGTFDLAANGESRFTENGMWVSGDFFNMLGVRPILGRVFTLADDQRGCGAPGVVISHSFWQREYGGARDVVGRKITLDGHPLEIIGVTPAAFYGVEVGRSYDVAMPICSEAIFRGPYSRLDTRNAWWLAIIGRLKPDWTLDKASAHLDAISEGIFQATVPPTYNADSVSNYLSFKLGAFPAGTGVSSLRSEYVSPLWLLLAIAGLVLLIACANLANLLLARATAREREIAVRLAIGASRGRLVRQFLAESLVLASIGAGFGIVLSQFLSQFIVAFVSTGTSPLFLDLQPDWLVLGFTAGLAILTCMLFGLAPALRATRVPPGAALKASLRGLTAGRERFSLRRVLVVSQVALSLVLVVTALLFVRTFRNLITLDAGFRQDGIVLADFDLRKLKLPAAQRRPFVQDLAARIQALPGVESVSDASHIPVSGSTWNQTVILLGTPQEVKGHCRFNLVGDKYFHTLEIPLLAGRDFDPRDTVTSPRVAVVNQTFAKKYLNGENPVGRSFKWESTPGEPDQIFEIVGLVADTKYEELREEFPPIAFLPASQDEDPSQSPQFLVRAGGPLASLISGIRGVAAGANPEINFHFHTLRGQIQESLQRERLMATLSGFFGALAALIAAVGLYGVISYMVMRRRNEIGIRMALGAPPAAVARMILREAGVLLAVGLSIGVVLAVVAARAADSLLYGLRPHDPATALLAMGALAAVALVASYLPARRAARLDPMVALRDE